MFAGDSSERCLRDRKVESLVSSGDAELSNQLSDAVALFRRKCQTAATTIALRATSLRVGREEVRWKESFRHRCIRS